MRFKSGKMIALESSDWAMLVIDSFTYDGEEFALAKRFDRDERAYRICQWDEREEASRFLSISNMRAELESDELIDDLAASAESLELGASGLRSIFSQAVNSRYYEAIRHGIPDEHETVLTIRKEDIQDAALHFEKRCKK